MGQQPNKYHMTDDGKVYRVNEDGSFTSIGNVEDLDKKTSTPSSDKMPPIPTPNVKTTSTTEVGWWKRNYNWLWVTTLVVFLGWFISCLSCAWPEYPQYDELGNISNWYTCDNTGEILIICAIVLVCFGLSWYLSNKNKTILKLAQILLIGCSAWVACLMLVLCEQRYSYLLICIATIPVTMWIITLCLSIFKRK